MASETPLGQPTWFGDLSNARLVCGSPVEAVAICHDSRLVVPGAIFVAVPGLTVDGNRFIPDAIARGASSIVVEEGLLQEWQPFMNEGSAFVAVPDARVALAEAAAAFYRYPARTLGTIGVTGTDGKTTTTHLIAHVLNENGVATGYLSSVEFGTGHSVELNASHMTTLEATEIQRYLASVRDAGCRYAAVEASSIGLDLHRVDMCEFDVGVFTNLTPDHLDYHGSMKKYREAKAILFRMLGASVAKGFPKAAILNDDDPASHSLRLVTTVPVFSYGLNAEADVTRRDIVPDGFGTRFAAQMSGESVPARTRLMGEYNVSNCLAAVATAVSQRVPFRSAVGALETFPGVPGRMELIDAGQEFRVVVDIASTEQSMRNVLRMLRPLTKGKLIVVFGAAGERDPGRRTGIARAVAGAADFAVITNEDPRSEDPQAIADEIVTALHRHGFGGNYAVQTDRRRAIELAFGRAGKGDTVLLAGKGTEQSIVIGTTHSPWDERGVARDLLQAQRPLEQS
ncbi:MAG: UDP-N-acetylmuramoyl-L-alanyl-D-glutamate--2,6-diaminopimelate ligase [Chloroflexota bacterium]|nr:UDP-N-acetylmuramoyl-L-alanyl-D-glutamate--2,6-diaminopimelate ligase [Chloroflexota bacterium]